MAQVALAWVTDRPGVTSTILGARTVEQLDDNLAAGELHLDADETARLDEVSEPVVHDYPYGVMGVSSANARSPAAGNDPWLDACGSCTL